MTSVGVLILSADECGEHLAKCFLAAVLQGGPPDSQSVNQSSSLSNDIVSRLKTPSCETAALKRSVCPMSQSTAYPPYLAPAIPVRCGSTNENFATASTTALRSTMTLPHQSCEISSTNRWPKPVEPRGFGAATIQPCAAHSAGFQREDHESPQSPCGPP